MLVVRAGVATVQDLGRPGYRAAGLPPGGAADRFALRLANTLVGNAETAAAIEIALGDFEFEAAAAGTVGTAGAIASVAVGDLTFPGGAGLSVRPGDRVRVRPDPAGRFGYLAVSGGIDVPLVLGSRSTYLPTGLGGQAGRRLQAGDRLRVGTSAGPAARRAAPAIPREDRPIRLCAGPQAGNFPFEAFQRLVGEPYRLSPTSDRMGSRLKGAALPLLRAASLPSEGTAVGAIQVPDDGQPIVILPDGPTVGGYPKIGVVASVDWGHFAQTPLGGTVQFEWISVAEAHRAARQAAAGQAALLTALRSP